jgi:hypothetical protein
MRWMFLLLLVLNAFYYLWHQQEVPLRAKEVTPLSLYRGTNQEIQLLSESATAKAVDPARQRQESCLYLGGDLPRLQIQKVEQRLTSLDIQVQSSDSPANATGSYWVKIAPGSRRLVDDSLLGSLRQDFPQLKSKIMSCEGIASVD